MKLQRLGVDEFGEEHFTSSVEDTLHHRLSKECPCHPTEQWAGTVDTPDEEVDSRYWWLHQAFAEPQPVSLERAEARIAQLEQERDALRIQKDELQRKLDAIVEAIGRENDE